MELPAEDQFQNKPRNFNDLDVLCLEAIFKFLPLRDLGAMTLTCKRYKEEAERFFKTHRETHCEPIKIKSTNGTIYFQFKPAEGTGYAYERVFKSLIRSVECTFQDQPTIEYCEFIKENCSKHMRSLTLNNKGNQRNDVTAIEVLKDRLEDLKELRIYNFMGPYNELLRLCLGLESLTIKIVGFKQCQPTESAADAVYLNTSLNQNYPNLKTLKLYVSNGLKVRLNRFLLLNPNLETLICSNVTAITDVCCSEAHLRRVAFVSLCPLGLISLMEVIGQWSKQKRFEEFELAVAGLLSKSFMLRMAATCKNITALHLGRNVDFFKTQDLNLNNFVMSSVKVVCVNLIPWFSNETSKELRAETSSRYLQKYDEDLLQEIRTQLYKYQLNRFFPNLCKLKMKVEGRFLEPKEFEFVNEGCDLCEMFWK